MQGGSPGRFNTPPTFALYVTGLMLRWIGRNGGVPAMAAAAQQRSRLLYSCVDNSDFYRCPHPPADRSLINVCFQLTKPGLTDTFLTLAERNGLANLRGHAAIGGIRASLYNPMPLTGVERLVEFMSDFERKHG